MKKNYRLLLWSMLMSALFIWFASKSSPLYPMNDWVDVNCFFTMGRSILDGLVPYRDLYEQKGPVLYFVYAIISLFSQESYFGVYLLEVVTYGLFLYFTGLLVQLYLGKTRLIYFLIAILAALAPISWSFTHGGSVEQLSLFMLVYGMYSTLRAIQENRGLTFRETLVNGIFAGILLWTKYTMLGFHLGLALFVAIWYMTDKPLRKALPATIGQFLLGVGIVSSTVFLYFGINGALSDLFAVYFYDNIVRYPTEVEGSRLEAMWKCLKSAMQLNTGYVWMIYAGFFWLLSRGHRNWKTALMPLLCFFFLTLGTYWGCKNYDYYGFIFVAFCGFGLIALGKLLQKWNVIALWHRLIPNDRMPAVCACILLVLSLTSTALDNNHNLYLSKIDKADTVQYRFAAIINTVENPTLLNYGFLDGGFYFASGATPACRYFCYYNVNPQEMWDSQRQCINNGETDFIVTRYYMLNAYSVDTSKYELVCTAEHPFDAQYTYTYYLYQKVS